mmetsp:Transcript_18131/g.32819  ORF Transcript_18131/g.32819 Transcript_18131/m.32819 type:complete len:255 (+) Transcript_18131:104-868(+)
MIRINRRMFIMADCQRRGTAIWYCVGWSRQHRRAINLYLGHKRNVGFWNLMLRRRTCLSDINLTVFPIAPRNAHSLLMIRKLSFDIVCLDFIATRTTLLFTRGSRIVVIIRIPLAADIAMREGRAVVTSIIINNHGCSCLARFTKYFWQSHDVTSAALSCIKDCTATNHKRNKNRYDQKRKHCRVISGRISSAGGIALVKSTNRQCQNEHDGHVCSKRNDVGTSHHAKNRYARICGKALTKSDTSLHQVGKVSQ